MSGIVRKSDKCSGHGAYPPRLSTSWSPNVYVNGVEVVRETDSWEEHCGGDCHTGVSSSGSPTVFANGLPICRQGDSISCGSTMPNASSNVFAS